MKTLVIGAGKSGVAAANFLARSAGVSPAGDAASRRVLLHDANPNPDLPMPLDPRVTRVFGKDPSLDDVNEIILSPGVPLTIPLLQRAAAMPIPIVGEIELAYRDRKSVV